MRCITHDTMRRSWRPRRVAGFTLIETVICLIIVSVMLAAALSTVAAARVSRYKINVRQRGELLAQELMAEILAQAYEEPEDAPAYGVEAPETATSRAAWDDVDDYRDWSASPPQEKDGTAIPGLDAWRRTVRIRRVDASDPTSALAIETGAKQIEITVSCNDMRVAKIVAIRTGAR